MTRLPLICLSLALPATALAEDDCAASLAEQIHRAQVTTRHELDADEVKALDACLANRADRMPEFFLPGSYFAYGQGLGTEGKPGQTKRVGDRTFVFNGESWVDGAKRAKAEEDFAELLVAATAEAPEAVSDDERARLTAWFKGHPERIPDQVAAGSWLAHFYETRPPALGVVAEFPSGSGRCWVYEGGVYRQAASAASGDARCTGSFTAAPPGSSVSALSGLVRAAVGGAASRTATATATGTGTSGGTATATSTSGGTRTATGAATGTATASRTATGTGTSTGAGTGTATGAGTGTATGTRAGNGPSLPLGRVLNPNPAPAANGACPAGSYLDPGEDGRGTPVVNAIIDVDCSPNLLIHGNYPGDWNETERFSDGSTQRASVRYPPETGDWPGSKMVGWSCPRGGTLQLLATSPSPGGRGSACGMGIPPCAKRRDAQGTPILQDGKYVKESCVYDSGGERHAGVPGICAQDNCASAHWACCLPCPADACRDPKHPKIPACCR